MLIDTRGHTRARIKLEPAQTGVVIGLQPMLQASGLILVCPRCLADGRSHLQGDVTAQTVVWKLECGCTVRVMERQHARHPFDADGDLIASASTVLTPLSLAVRCPESKCVGHPLEIERGDTSTIVRCRCAKTTFRNPSPIAQ